MGYVQPESVHMEATREANQNEIAGPQMLSQSNQDDIREKERPPTSKRRSTSQLTFVNLPCLDPAYVERRQGSGPEAMNFDPGGSDPQCGAWKRCLAKRGLKQSRPLNSERAGTCDSYTLHSVLDPSYTAISKLLPFLLAQSPDLYIPKRSCRSV